MTRKFIATIRLTNNQGCGSLYWDDGTIMCMMPSGEAENTETPCDLVDAIKTIRAAWGHGWDLRFTGAMK